eukprot:TRINITY_DN19835_c0_g1_i1.p2 TRINITY_DN19835_c0_g1~~TRINITY_DN19835_c0_g1_i1.p2  ORF type:complete len:106 (+),score=12.74 TRINITY_DN19835_c0_g1_i1:75-392(+)
MEGVLSKRHRNRRFMIARCDEDTTLSRWRWQRGACSNIRRRWFGALFDIYLLKPAKIGIAMVVVFFIHCFGVKDIVDQFLMEFLPFLCKTDFMEPIFLLILTVGE